MTNNTQDSRRPPFGLVSASGLVIANMIGAGVFTTSGFSLLGLSREYVLSAWVVAGAIAMCGAYSYGLLAARISESGGEYLFLSRNVHPSIGFIAGWVSLLQGFTGAIAFAAITFETYAFPEPLRPDWFRPGFLAIAAILIFAALHSWVFRKGMATQNVVVALKLALLCGFLCYAYAVLPTRGWTGVHFKSDRVFSWFAFATSLVYISLSYSGFNAAVYISEEIRDAKRNVPRAMLVSTALVMLIYVALNGVFVYGPDPGFARGEKEIAALAAVAIGGQWGNIIVRIAICLALLSSVSSMIIAGPRVYAKMADDGVFPEWFRFGQIRGQRVPALAIWFQAILAAIVVSLSDLRQLLEFLAFTLSISAALTATCVFFNRPKIVSRWQKFLSVILPLVYIAATLTLAGLVVANDLVNSKTWWYSPSLIGFLLTIMSGLLIYFSLRQFRQVASSQK
jgi:amino acid transporter